MAAGKKIMIAILVLVFFSNCGKKNKLFTLLNSNKTNIHFNNKVNSTDSLNFLDYLYFYNGGGVATGDINNDGLVDIYFTANAKANNKLYLNKGNFVFEDITNNAGVNGISDWCTGVTMVDINSDGLLDIYVCAISGKLGLKGQNQLFINKGNNKFDDEAQKYGLNFSGYSTQAAFFDYDKDGLLDCYLLNQSMHSVETYGDTSLRKKTNSEAGDILFKNTNSKFVNVSQQAGIYSSAIGYGLGIAIGDLNNDGWDDIYVGNDFHENDYYYVNNKSGGFIESGAKVFGHYSRFSMGNDIADYNNDGMLDIFTTDMLPKTQNVLATYASDEQTDLYNYKIIQNGFQPQYSRNCLQKNLNNGQRFSEVGLMSNVAATDWSWAPLLADFDNDGIKDLFVSNGIVKRAANLDYLKYTSEGDVKRLLTKGRTIDKTILDKMPDGKVHNFIFKGNTTEIFSDESLNWGLETESYSNGSSYADLDNDGDLDLVINNINAEAFVYQNNTKHQNYLKLKCEAMPNNSFGIGAKAYLFNKGQIQYQQLQTSRGFQSGVNPIFNFGLDTCNNIDSVLLVWPNNFCQLAINVKANKMLRFNFADAKNVFDYEKYFPKKASTFIDITEEAQINFTHTENLFYDNNSQLLIPHQLSTKGPKIAVADVNNDELDDFYICGAKGNAGKLYIQNANGSFKDVSKLLKLDSTSEQTDAIFFDANKDGYKDLYITTGGNQEEGILPSLKDHLFINKNGNGFEESFTLPMFYSNKSMVLNIDLDADGDQDLFVGGQAVAGNYGAKPKSYVLLNDGNANYEIDTLKYGQAFLNIGMVTAGKVADINNDKKPDLVITGEWMATKIFYNTGTTFNEIEVGKTGWWQHVNVADINNDGYIDIFAGNYGINTKLTAPLKLYIKDFDNNGQQDPILTYTPDNKKEYTFLLKDELEKQLPYLKKDFLLYKDFAGKTVNEIFNTKLNDAIVLNAETLKSVIFINNKNGGFIEQELPTFMQTAPIFASAFCGENSKYKYSMMYCGNFFGTIPYEGRYDAMPAAIYNYSKNTNALDNGLTNIMGEFRDAKIIKLANNKTGLLMSRNNNKLKLLLVE